MTTYYHDPLTAAEASSLVEVNERFGDLDAAIYGIGLQFGKSITAIAGENLGNRGAAYLNLADSKIYLMDNDASGPKAGRIRGFVDGGVLSGATATLVISGFLDGFSSLSPYAPIYVSSVAGGITQTRPVPSSGGSQVFVADMGFAVSADSIFIQPKPISYQLRDAVILNEVLTVIHPADARPYLRVLSANVVVSSVESTVVLDWWTSTFADMVNRYGDGSGADLSTKTSFKCLKAAGFADITVCVDLP